MRKISALVLCFIFLLSLCSCGFEQNNDLLLGVWVVATDETGIELTLQQYKDSIGKKLMTEYDDKKDEYIFVDDDDGFENEKFDVVDGDDKKVFFLKADFATETAYVKAVPIYQRDNGEKYLGFDDSCFYEVEEKPVMTFPNKNTSSDCFVGSIEIKVIKR